MTNPTMDNFAEAEGYLRDLDSLNPPEAYIAVIAAQAHATLAQATAAAQMVELQKTLLASMLPSPTPQEQVKAEATQTGGFCTCYPNEKAPDCGISEHRREARIHRDPMDDAPEHERADVAPEETDDYKLGASDFVFAALRALRQLRSEAITSERKSAYDTAIKTVEGLQP